MIYEIIQAFGYLFLIGFLCVMFLKFCKFILNLGIKAQTQTAYSQPQQTAKIINPTKEDKIRELQQKTKDFEANIIIEYEKQQIIAEYLKKQFKKSVIAEYKRNLQETTLTDNLNELLEIAKTNHIYRLNTPIIVHSQPQPNQTDDVI